MSLLYLCAQDKDFIWGWHRQDAMAVEDASARLLPLPSYQSCKSNKPAAVVFVSLVLNVTLITTVATIYGYSFWMASDKPLTPQWADAIQAAELAAANLCSGHGNVFVDTVAVNADGTPACECNACFTGPDCSVSVPDCIADVNRLGIRPPSFVSHN